MMLGFNPSRASHPHKDFSIKVMENLNFRKPHEFSLSLLLLLLLLSFVLSSSAYTLPDKFFINCGSGSNVTSGVRTFIGDLIAGNSVSFTKKGSSEVETDTQSASTTSSVYQTARIFRKSSSSYKFNIISNGIYMIRLHFSGFSSEVDLSTARFGVSASGVSLLADFSVGNSTNTPQVKEFLLAMDKGTFIISFAPKSSSFAFVNAIEVFPAPENFIPDDLTHVSSTVSTFKGLNSKVLQSVYRLNVGGVTITPENDTLWRNWYPDDDYLYHPYSARNSKPYLERPKFFGLANDFIAPDFVYQTAKEMNISTSRQSNNFNVTWSFEVTKNIKYFVRVHFCDILTLAVDGNFVFNLYINVGYHEEISPYNRTGRLAAPFYVDLVVDSDDSGVFNVSIGPNRNSDRKTAFLNGLEIMEIIGESSPVSSTESNMKKQVLMVALPVVGGLILISVLVFLIFLKHKKSKPVVETSDWSPLPGYGGGSSHTRVFEGTVNNSSIRNINLGLRISFSDILIATNNFDAKFLVGKGGFGDVYKGVLANGTKVAVKRGKPGSGQGLSEFQTEIQVLSKIKHLHLVSLIGYCDENSEMILVYEFMEKGTLKDHLYGSDLPTFSWKQRLEVCIGSARGLHYLHRGSASGIIHRDVKSTNILLDENYVAKVADFGLSKYGPPGQNQKHVSTGIKGTFGYLDPEYFRSQILTEKSDVYSFGVVLLEVLCARPAIDRLLPSEEVNLAEWGMFCKDKGIIEEIVDQGLTGQINSNSLRKFVEVVEKCLREDGSDRPSMADVLWDLEYALQLQQTAVHREPHEDSGATGGSSVLGLPNLRGSFSSKMEASGLSVTVEENPSLSACEVFSQNKNQ